MCGRVQVDSRSDILCIKYGTSLGSDMIVVAAVVSVCLACFVWIQPACSVAILISHSESMKV